MQIGERLRLARGALGYTLDRVAAETNIGQSSLSDFENDKREPRFSQLSRLAELYRRPVEFFLGKEPVVENVMLWRDAPDVEDQVKATQARFRQLCEQYHSLELLCGERKNITWPQPDVKRSAFSFRDAGSLADDFERKYLLGDIPSASLKQVLEERFGVKVFHLDFAGSAISTWSQTWGPAILLNSRSKLWRRNFDLAHELFHLLTWSVFRDAGCPTDEPEDHEEELANAFASRLLLPTDVVKARIEQSVDGEGKINLETLDEVAREFGVSLDALLWRMVYLYNMSVEDIQNHIEHARGIRRARPARQTDGPDMLPERYCSLAIRALNEGRLSLTQFAKFMGLSYKRAQEYLMDEGDLTDEEVSIPVA
ncbi:MAG: helix-turn-helix domain-containing protein [Sedimentisphaerales bacterium]|nr:helix-turn-helix domain-containing protein [Sedimentisphaerales bacterium]